MLRLLGLGIYGSRNWRLVLGVAGRRRTLLTSDNRYSVLSPDAQSLTHAGDVETAAWTASRRRCELAATALALATAPHASSIPTARGAELLLWVDRMVFLPAVRRFANPRCVLHDCGWYVMAYYIVKRFFQVNGLCWRLDGGLRGGNGRLYCKSERRELRRARAVCLLIARYFRGSRLTRRVPGMRIGFQEAISA